MEKQNIKSIAITIFAFLGLLNQTIAQNSSPEMADAMRANGKIYVVVAVLAIIFVGIVLYLVSIDRKATKLEKEIEKLK